MCMKQIIQYHSNGIKYKEYYLDDNDLIQGELIQYWDNGLPRQSSIYENNSLIYHNKLWYQTGHLQRVVDRSAGKSIAGNWPCTEYNSAGHITCEYILDENKDEMCIRSYCGTSRKIVTNEYTITQQGRKDGLFSSCYDSGLLKEKIHYLDGRRHGPYAAYFDSVKFDENKQPTNTQLVEITGEFKDDERHGEFREYYRAGALFRIKHYENGAPHGITQEYSPTGTLTLETVYYRGAQSMYDKRYNNAGVLVRHCVFDEQNRVVSDYRYANDGKPQEEHHWEYRNYSKFYKELKRYENGNLLYHATYDNSIPNKTSYTEYEYNAATGFRKSITEVKNTEESRVTLKFHYSADGKPRRISLIIDGVYQTADFKKLLKKKTSEIDDSDIAYIKLTYF